MTGVPYNPKSSGCHNLVSKKEVFWILGRLETTHRDAIFFFRWSPFPGEGWSSSSEEPQKKWGEPLSWDASRGDGGDREGGGGGGGGVAMTTMGMGERG